MASGWTPPYASGPTGRLLARLDRRPLDGIWLVTGLFVALVAWTQVIEWSTGRVPFGTIDQYALILAVYGPFVVAFTAIGARVAKQAVVTFWPATGWPVDEQRDWIYRFQTPPVRADWVALAIGLAGALAALVASPESVMAGPGGRAAAYVAYGPSFVAGYGLTVAGTAVGIRWLRLVMTIHRNASRLDPFDRIPIYAFSRLAVVPAISVLIMVTHTIALNSAFQAGNTASIAFLGGAAVLGVVAFIVPLWGIHGRLVRIKEQLRFDLERRVGRLGDEMYARVDAGDFAAVSGLNTTLEGLGTLRERIDRLPTWPWPPQLLRGLLSALFLPVIVYVLTRVASTVVGG